ncbi:hypothetical protein [Armatimonas sp.]|uniref:hypothetical protein n=1 Tax=Armatimonas sp. TaxID=1872638 RepID=UPI00286A216B|nr:hypothetical protein [Armatimonas sp.]
MSVTRVIARPPAGTNTVTETFSDLSIGNYTAKATAYPNPDGTGVAQASGSVSLTIVKDQTVAASLTMASTISKVDIYNNGFRVEPGAFFLALGDSLILTAVAFDGSGKRVAVDPNQWEWGSNNTGDFTFTPSGATALVRTSGGTPPNALYITLKEKESGRLAFPAGIISHAKITIEGLGHLTDIAVRSSYATGISDDGGRIVGYSRSNSATEEAFLYTQTGGMQVFGNLGTRLTSVAYGISGDGNYLVGMSSSSSDTLAFRGTAATGFVWLDDLAGGANSCTAYAASLDGSVVVGKGSDSQGEQAFRWSVSGGMQGLGKLAGGSYGSWAYGVSRNGNVVVGASYSSATTGTSTEAFRWTASGGIVGMGFLPGFTANSRALAASTDGSVIVGASGARAFRWTAATGMVNLGELAPGNADHVALGVSPDGTTVVGTAKVGPTTNAAWVWTQATGIQNLMTVIQNNGIDVFGMGIPPQYRWGLSHATGISSDKKTIVGYGRHGTSIEAFRIYKSDGWDKP